MSSGPPRVVPRPPASAAGRLFSHFRSWENEVPDIPRTTVGILGLVWSGLAWSGLLFFYVALPFFRLEEEAWQIGQAQ